MLSLRNILLFTVAATASVVRRDAATITSDLQTIDMDVNALTAATKSFSGGLFGAIPVQNAEGRVEDDIDQATTDAQNSGAVNSADSTAIIDYINSTLEPDISDAVDAIIAKKRQFAGAGLSGTVRSDLNSLKSKTDSLGQALISKAAAGTTTQAQAALSAIDADFQRAISAYA